MIRTYSELIRIPTYDDRYRYLKLSGKVAEETFGYDRYLNQVFYNSKEWGLVRDYVIARDLGFDLAAPDHEISGLVVVHHMNPITIEDIQLRDPKILDPELLICTSDITHKAIHYGDESLLPLGLIERTANDTCPWK